MESNDHALVLSDYANYILDYFVLQENGSV